MVGEELEVVAGQAKRIGEDCGQGAGDSGWRVPREPVRVVLES